MPQDGLRESADMRERWVRDPFRHEPFLQYEIPMTYSILPGRAWSAQELINRGLLIMGQRKGTELGARPWKSMRGKDLFATPTPFVGTRGTSESMKGLRDEWPGPGHAWLGGHGLGTPCVMESSLAVHTLEVRAYKNDIPVLALVPCRAFFEDASHAPNSDKFRLLAKVDIRQAEGAIDSGLLTGRLRRRKSIGVKPWPPSKVHFHFQQATGAVGSPLSQGQELCWKPTSDQPLPTSDKPRLPSEVAAQISAFNQ